jgi:membrane associated rhomboid family serine protease
MLLLILIVLALGFAATNPDERQRLLRAAQAAVLQQARAVSEGAAEAAPFRQALRERTRWAVVTTALAGLHVAMFVLMLFGAGALNDPNTIVGWGGSIGTRTTNGEWWRLLTMTFVQPGFFQLLVSVAALVQLGLLLERLVGPLVFGSVYLAAGFFAGLVSVSVRPVEVSVGATGAIFGLYGLLLASSCWTWLHRSAVTISPRALKELAPAAVVFVLYAAGSDRLPGSAELAGLAVGLLCGLVLTQGVEQRLPSPRRVAAVMAGAAAIAVAAAISLRGITDARPEIALVVALEDRTAGDYRAAMDKFKRGRLTAEALSQLIDQDIVPELVAADERLKALNGVPREHRTMVEGAEEYLRLRADSWRLRADGLRRATRAPSRNAGAADQESGEVRRLRAEQQHQSNMQTLGKADTLERVSLEALERIRPVDGTPQEPGSAHP